MSVEPRSNSARRLIYSRSPDGRFSNGGLKGGSEEGCPPIKEMVPSDLISSLTLYRYARHGALQTKEPDVSPLSSPKAVFLQLPDQCFLARRKLPSARDRSLVTAFRSPVTGAASQRPPSQGQSSQPATSLPCQIAFMPGPPSAPLPQFRFAPVAAASSPRARCTSTTRSGLPRPLPPLPSRTFTSLGIKTLAAIAAAGPPDESARFPLAPRRPFY